MPLPTIHSVRAAFDGYGPPRQRGTAYAAVAIVLCECKAAHDVHPPHAELVPQADNSLTHVLLIQRATHPLDPWSGHLAFPGGRQDPTDESGLATAVREAREEVGIELEPARQLLGQLAPVTARGAGQPGLVIEPFVFEAPYQPVFHVDQTEVARAFWVPIPALIAGERDTFIEIHRGTRRFRMPAYQIEDQVLWGMSYEILRSLAKLARWLQ